jgi:hypothetical protein
MRRRLALVLLFVCAGVFRPATAVAGSADPVEVIKNFSDFQQIDLNRLLSGDILSERDAVMDFPNGISAQTCFAVPLTADETAKRLQFWDPSPHPELKVYAFHTLHTPCILADFQPLGFKNGPKPVRWLLDKTVASTPTSSELNLTRDEAGKLAGCVQERADPQTVSACWAKLLLARASAFQQKGLDGVSSYEVGGETVSPSDQLRAMLREQLSVSHEFLPILKKIGLVEKEAEPSLSPFYYWTLFDADYHGTISLGAVYLLAVGDHFQLADLEYYVSGNYYTSATLYEVWPVQVNGKSAAIVWRGDYFAAPTLRFAKGTERIAYGVLMLQDIKKETHCIQDEAKSKR